MKRIAIVLSMLFAACTTPSYPGIDRPNTGGSNSQTDRDIIAYIDERLENEYLWLDEVATKSHTFNRNVEWDDYLGASLSRLTTNGDDGYVNANGQRVYYSFIRELSNSLTRAEVKGFGIDMHTTIVFYDKDNNYYGFIIEDILPGSPAEAADLRRGDVIVKVNNSYITPNNYVTLFNKVQINGNLSKVDLQIYRRVGDSGAAETLNVSLDAAYYSECKVAHSEVIEGEKRVGYIVYTGFEPASDEALLAALHEFDEAGVDEVILDLRINSGGSVSSAQMLASALLPASYEGSVLCEARRNPKNIYGKISEEFPLVECGVHLDLDHLTVITSSSTASASELIIMGLRGLDIPVTVVGSTTNGKNCGMDVTRRTIGTTYLEYAPITFMCLNAKGEGDWGDGIQPDVDVMAMDESYPLPRAPWGSEYDVALMAALESVGCEVSTTTRAMASESFDAATTLAEPIVGMRIYREDGE